MRRGGIPGWQMAKPAKSRESNRAYGWRQHRERLDRASLAHNARQTLARAKVLVAQQKQVVELALLAPAALLLIEEKLAVPQGFHGFPFAA